MRGYFGCKLLAVGFQAAQGQGDPVAHVFQKFYRVDNSDTRTIGGTGLGLFIARSRAEAMEGYLAIIKDALDAGIRPRCHFEDITRADFYGFVVPFAGELDAGVNK